MITLLLVCSLGFNGWLMMERGELTQSHEQLQETYEDQQKIVEKYYAEVDDLETAFLVAKQQLKDLHEINVKQAVQLENLKHSNANVRDYLQQVVPPELVDHINNSNEDGVQVQKSTEQLASHAPNTSFNNYP